MKFEPVSEAPYLLLSPSSHAPPASTDACTHPSRFQTLRQMFQELNRASPKGLSQRERRPVLLMLGGGMAAGKSTVREIIGQDNFWTKVGMHAVLFQEQSWKDYVLLVSLV